MFRRQIRLAQGFPQLFGDGVELVAAFLEDPQQVGDDAGVNAAVAGGHVAQGSIGHAQGSGEGRLPLFAEQGSPDAREHIGRDCGLLDRRGH